MARIDETSSRKKIHNALLIFFLATVILAIEAALYSIRWIFLIIVIGSGLSVLFSPVMRLLKERLKIPQGVSAAVFLALLFAIIGGISFLVYTVISDQLVPLLEKLPQLIEQSRARISPIFGGYPSLQKQLRSFDLGAALGAATQSLAQGLRIGASALGGFVFVIVFALYVAIQPDSYVAGILSLFPARRRPRLKVHLEQAAVSLRHWFASQLIAMAAVGTATGLGLWVVGIDYWLLFGVLTAVLDIIPYIGPLVSATGAVLVTFATTPGKVIWVVGLYILMQQIEGHLVIPLVMKKRVDLPPAHLMSLMLILGSWFGVLGLLVAPGLLAVLRTLYLTAYLPEMNREEASSQRSGQSSGSAD